MPELPEVETIRRRLAERIIGKTIRAVSIARDKSFLGDPQMLEGQTIQAVDRKAKIIQLVLNDDLYVLVHLKMTGQLILQQASGTRVGGGHPTADWVQSLPSKHTRVEVAFTDDDVLYFNDQRVFGWLKVVNAAAKKQEFSRYGKDINDPTLSFDEFAEKIYKTRRPIKLALLDSAIVAGLGNIYVCDALNLARISPFRSAQSLNQTELFTLFQAAQTVIERGIKLKGTTFDGKYVDVSGFAGGYQEEALVYGQTGKPCKNCGTAIQKQQQNGRGTYFCPNCQL